VIIVTHEPDIAAHTHRVVSMLDGVVISDEPVTAPRQAAALEQEAEGQKP